MAELAAFAAMRNTASMRALLVMMSLKPSVPARLLFIRASSPSSALAARALRSETCRRSAPTGLTTKSVAPARMAVTTLSIPPWAVWTITGVPRPNLPHFREHAKSVEIRHDKIEHHGVDARLFLVRKPRYRGIAAFGHHWFVAEPAHHVFQKPPLHRVIIDDQNTLNHTQPRTDTTRVPIWGSVTELR